MSIIQKKDFEKQSKHFGLLLSIFFFILAVYLIFIKSIFLGQFLLILSGTFFLVSIAIPKSLSRITKLWLRFGDILGRVVSPITLGLIFFILIAPIGMLTRLFGRDELLLKKKNKKSYWLARQKTDDKFNSFERQF
jgi:membrane glycosyltransferase